MFGKKQGSQPVTPARPTTDESVEGKGRPTPSRRDSEAARKTRVKVSNNSKEAKKASRDRARLDRERSRKGMMAGDERYLQARDQGPGKAFTRDFVDSRFAPAEYFIVVAILVLALGFVPVQAIQLWVTLGFFAFAAIMVVDVIIMVVRLNRTATKTFNNPADRKGLTLYAVLRVMQFRRLRLPPPRVKRGGLPK